MKREDKERKRKEKEKEKDKEKERQPLCMFRGEGAGHRSAAVVTHPVVHFGYQSTFSLPLKFPYTLQ